MKGIVFTEFLDLVEDKFGYPMVDTIINESTLQSGGVYTAVGTYSHTEMMQLVSRLSEHTNIGVQDLLKVYGLHFFAVLAKNYGHFLKGTKSSFELFEAIHHHIHVEVRKLYPDAELPHFDTTRIAENTLEMVYTSERQLSAFAEGLIESCMTYYNEKGTVSRENISEDGKKVRFTITKQ